jgi:perosamine synthetase
MTRTVYLDTPNVGSLEKKYLCRAVDSGYVSTIGPFVPEFEARFAKLVDVKAASATQSGTAALHVALHELDIGPGDEVIVPALTFVATVNPIIYTGAKPVFADVDPLTWTIDPICAERLISKKTKAIMPVHLYGNPCVMPELMRLARRHKLMVIEDATESFGGSYDGRATGTWGDLGCFSFNGNKVITTGGGGMVVGNNVKRLAHIKFLVNQGRDVSRGHDHPEVGFNYRMTNIEAAVGLAQLDRVAEFLKNKERFHAIYRRELESLDGVRLQKEFEGAKSSWWLNCVHVERPVAIDALQKKLAAKNIQSRRIFAPVNTFAPYKKFRSAPLKNSALIYKRGLCLPSSTLNSDSDILYVCEQLKKVI